MLFELNAVDVYYGERRALESVTLSLSKGRIGLLGPNGAGKTTLLRTLLGLATPSTGTVRVLDLEVECVPLEVRNRIGYMPEAGGLLPELSALEHVRLAAEFHGLPREEAIGRAQQTLHYVGLGEARHRRVGSLSTGMQQRVRLAQALVASPDLLLLDEPTSGLDPQGREEMLALLADIPARTGSSLLLSTHILPDVERTCDQVILLTDGQVLYSGDLESLVRPDRLALEVRVKGDAASFRTVLELGGCVVTPKPTGLIVRLPEGASPALILRMAHENNEQVRHLAPLVRTLEEAFFEKLEAATG